MKVIENAKWNFEPCEAHECTVKVKDVTDLYPLFWGRDIIGKYVHAVRVRQHDSTFFLYDGDKSGTFKVTTGKGSPNCGHRGIVALEVHPRTIP